MNQGKENQKAKSVTRTYKDAGVDIDAGNEVVRRIAPLVKTTHDAGVITDIGGFSGLYSLKGLEMDDPVLVSSTDGVGSKLKLAVMTGRHETIGVDLVAMGVNDILAQGARPLFFLDYLAMNKVTPDLAEAIVSGIVEGCRQAGCALIGGETAELPDFYASGDYDLAGFAVGVVERSRIIDGARIAPGDAIIGLASSGLHSNGYTLVRRLLLEDLGLGVDDPFLGATVGEVLLRPTRIYAKTLLNLLDNFDVRGVAHITGGGLPDNLPRMLPDGAAAEVEAQSWPKPEIFTYLQDAGGLAEAEMYRTFNMGLGMAVVLPADQAQPALSLLRGLNEPAWPVGRILERNADQPVFELVQ